MEIRTSLKPGDIGAVVQLHGTLYAKEFQLDYTFEGYVASGLGEFAQNYDEQKDFVALVEDSGQVLGCIAIVGLENLAAQLRWFVVHPSLRGRGLGRRLLETALSFCRERGFRTVFLWTISELQTAAHLYKEAGFECTERLSHEIWGTTRTEERYDLTL